VSYVKDMAMKILHCLEHEMVQFSNKEKSEGTMSGEQGAHGNTLNELAMDIADVSHLFCEFSVPMENNSECFFAVPKYFLRWNCFCLL
jgi:hypothetical protein